MDADTPYHSIERDESQEPIPTTEIDDENPEYYGQDHDHDEVQRQLLEEASTEIEDDDDDDDDDDSSSADEEQAPLELPIRRHTLSSAGSHYASSSDEELPRPQLRDNAIEHDLGHPSSDASRYSPDHGLSSPLKRRRSPSAEDTEPRPFKRSRGIFMPEYLDLLNADIEQAAARLISRDEPDLAPSQVGLTFWDSTEKEVLYESLARLGPDDVPGIAARIKTKGVLEVASYLHLLRKTRRAQGHLDRIKPANMPAAAELSQACCNALEEAADDISVREEIREEADEAIKWGGEDRWLITPANCHILKKEQHGDKPFWLLRTRRMLHLSNRIFMNASFAESNWSSMSAEPPSLRMTAHGDFYNLVVSFTRRLVAATMYVTESRIRTKDTLAGPFEEAVRREDVDAAVISLGVSPNSEKFWTGCARRLRLAVVDTGDDSDSESDWTEDEANPTTTSRPPTPFDHEDLEPMSYPAVEAALTGQPPPSPTPASPIPSTPSASPSPSPSPSPSGSSPPSSPAPPTLESPPDIPPALLASDIAEARTHTLLDRPLTKRGRRALKARIWASHADEAHADATDARAAQLEERRMWGVLEREPPEDDGAARPREGASPGTGRGHWLDGMVFAGAAGEGGWIVGDGRGEWEVETEVLIQGRGGGEMSD